MEYAAQKEAEELFLRHGQGVGRYFLARVGDPELAEELAARVFLTVVRKIEQCSGSPTAWLWTICRTELAKYFRDNPRHASPTEDLQDVSTPPLEELERQEIQERLRGAMNRLPEEHVKILYFKFFLRLRNTEIAEAIGITATHIGTLVHRLLQQLKSWILRSEPAPPEVRPDSAPAHSGEDEHA